MRFQITIREQAQAINGKAKYPLYKPKTQRNYEKDYGIETLDELIENSSIKIYCNQCLKQITFDTIAVVYQDHEIPLTSNQATSQNNQQKPTTQQQPLQKQSSNINSNINKKDLKSNSMSKKDGYKQMQNDDNQLFEQSESIQMNKQQYQQHHENSNNGGQRLDQQVEGNENMKALSEQLQKQQLQQNSILPKQMQKEQQQSHPTHYQTSSLYCVGCFSSLQQFPTSYTIRKSLNVSIKGQKWRIIDQICLLNGLKCWGFGNWGQIKQFMDYNGCPFTVKEIQQHYEEIYLNGEGPFKEVQNLKDKDMDVYNQQQLYKKLLSKPSKRLIEQIMHNYYFPKEQQQGCSRVWVSNKVLQGNIIHSKESLQMKRQRPKEFDHDYDSQQIKKPEQLQQKVQLEKVLSGHSKGLPSSMHPQGGAKSIFHSSHNNNISSSYTSLKNVLQKEGIQGGKTLQQEEMQQKYVQHGNENDDESEQEDEDEEELFQQEENEIKLKPKQSQIQLSATKMIHNNSNGNKFINEPLSLNKLTSIKPQSTQKLNPNIQHCHQTHSHHNFHHHPTYSNLKGHNVYSYNPKRKQFEIIQYDYYAQTMLAQLQFLDDDTQQQQLLKIKIIEEYNRRLDERIKRREFVIEHRLLDTDFMIKTLQKYNPNHVQKFQPFRRLVPKNQEYFQIVSTYDTLCKTKALTQGLIKIKKKLKKTVKNPSLQHVLEYLGAKKDKKELLGQRGKFEKEKQRKILTRENVGNGKVNKRVITSMTQNSSSYANIQQQSLSSFSLSQRRMASRSQQRQRLRLTSKQQQKIQTQQPIDMDQIILTANQMKIVNCNQFVINGSNLQSLISEEDMLAIEKMMKKQQQLAQNNNSNNNKQDGTIKRLILKNNLLAVPLNYWLKDNSNDNKYA